MQIERLDLNLLRLFDAVYRTRQVSRAAEQLGITQPAASQGLTRLRLLLGDALFARRAGGMQPTPKAQRLASAVRAALSLLEQALAEAESFDPLSSRKVFRCHLSDIGEARFLPELMTALHRRAPGVRVECQVLAHDQITQALDTGAIDFAIGFLPSVNDVRRAHLLDDRYVVLLREGHPFVRRARPRTALADLARLEFVAVRSHSETLRILHLLRLEDRIRLSASHFLALPAIVRATDLGVVMPADFARRFAAAGDFAIVEPRLPLRDFSVSLHWSQRHEGDASHRWMRELICELFSEARGG